MASPLSDLDELVIKCRNIQARNYIKEAVACYKAGAFRASIVSAWVAVSFDIIDKLKELTLSGDKEAEIHHNTFEDARTQGDITKSLKFEREILKICRDKLELISHVEFIDLDRLQEDRNRCAHPSMTHDAESFMPSAELARIHIRSAVEHLLQYPPAQGKTALEGLVKLLDSEYFPTDFEKAVVVFKNSPLNKARKSLVSNFVKILLKQFIKSENDKEINCLATALNAVEHLHREIFIEVLESTLSNLVRPLPDDKLHIVLNIFEKISESWEYLDEDIQDRIELYIATLPKEYFDHLEYLFAHPVLGVYAQKRLNNASRVDIDASIFVNLPNPIADKIIDLYSSSDSFEQANSFASTVIRYAADYSYQQVKRIVTACGNNDQIEYSFEIASVLNALRRNKLVTNDEVDAWLQEVNLDKFVKKKLVEAEG